MLHVHPEIFKAYDIRGVYPKELDEKTAYLIARGYAQFLQAKKIVVGQDARPSSEKLFESFVRGLVDEGVEVHVLGLASTPYLYFAANQADYDGAVNITASHNPPEYNGFKLTRERAIPIAGDTGLKDILSIIENDLKSVRPARAAGKVVQKDYSNVYLYALTRQRAIGDFKIALDTGNGMAGLTAPSVLNKFPQLEVIPLYTEIDGTFPNHLANPLDKETLNDLREVVNREKCDLGIAFDGDGDRVAFITHKGEIVRGDLMTVLLGKRQLVKYPGGKILYDIRSSWVVPEEIQSVGGEAQETRAGHSFIKQAMRSEGAVFAGELSMHYFFKDFYTTDNGCFAMLELLELLTEAQKPLQDLIDPMKKYHQSGEINLEVADREGLINAIRERYKDGSQNELDGLSVTYDQWHFNLRASNTEPLVRLNIESKDSALLKQKRNEMAEIISKYQ